MMADKVPSLGGDGPCLTLLGNANTLTLTPTLTLKLITNTYTNTPLTPTRPRIYKRVRARRSLRLEGLPPTDLQVVLVLSLHVGL